MIIDILPVFLVITMLIGIKPMKPISTMNEQYLSISTVKCYKGLFAIVVVFHHLAQRTQGGIVFRYFSLVGYLAVAIFFFFSGYGLQKSYITKKKQYCSGFLKKRIPTVLIPYIVVTALYWIMYYFTGKYYSIIGIIKAILSGAPIVSFSWYVITILVFYFAFWILMKVCKTNYYTMIIGGGIWYVVYTICCIKMGFSSWWYNTAHLLIVGMIWAIFEKELLAIIKKYQSLFLVLWVIFAIVFVQKWKIAQYIPLKGMALLLNVATSALFVICVLFFSMKVQINNRILAFWGDISFELYLIHGLFISLLRNDSFYVKNEFAWVSLVLLFSILGSYVLHLLFTKLITKNDVL